MYEDNFVNDKLDKANVHTFVFTLPKISYTYDLEKTSCAKFKIEFLIVENGSCHIMIFYPYIHDWNFAFFNVLISQDLDAIYIKDAYMDNDDMHLQVSATIIFATAVLLTQKICKLETIPSNNLHPLLLTLGLILSSFLPSWFYIVVVGIALLWLFTIFFFHQWYTS